MIYDVFRRFYGSVRSKLTQQLKKEAEEWAARQGISINQFILWAVAEKLGALRSSVDDPSFPHITCRRGAARRPF